MQRDMSRGPSVDRELKRLTQLLTLTDAQQAQVKTLLTEQKQQMDALRKSAQAEDGNPETDREKMQAVRAVTDSKIEALLSDDQKSKYAAWQEQRKAAMERNRRGQEDQPPPPPDGGPPPGF
jgi:septal ring factor EnvC (AmiA/AmiB activator)